MKYVDTLNSEVYMASHSHSNLSIIEAVETLSHIADLEIDKGVGITQQHEVMIDNEKINYRTVHWLHEKDASETISLVRETFRVILHYLKQFYRKEYGYVTDPKTVEGIKTIMVLVGEAAKKLDKYTALFHLAHKQSVTELKEYKQLQEFYLSKIDRKIDERVLGKWILGLTFGRLHKETKPHKLVAKVPAPPKIEEAKHVFVDLESVKKDTEYELFFIRKEDGSRFFSPRLLRNIKLVCDFGEYFGEPKETDPLQQVKLWQDRIFHISARNVIKAVGPRLAAFFKEMYKLREHDEVVEILSKAFMGLLLASNPHNMLKGRPAKSCLEYFNDFLIFLREAVHSRPYQKWLAYPPNGNNALATELLDIVFTTCRAVYAGLQGLEEMISIVHILIQQASKQISEEHFTQVEAVKMIWNQLAADYTAMTKLMRNHPNGPLLKVLDILEENTFNVFDPLMQQNIPSQLYELQVQNHKMLNIRFAAPVIQEFINKDVVNEEFKAFLRDYNKQRNKKKHLLINLQDRTSWTEHARCSALEDLQKQPEMQEVLTVVTLAIDTDFYHQLSPYHQVNHASAFIEQFKEHLKGESSGFYFPETINKKELFEFMDRAIESIHRIFFSNKNVLLREHRLDFIEIFYLFLQLKLIDMVSPNTFSFTCKDGVDIGMAISAELFTFLKFLHQKEWSESDIDFLNFLIYAPALVIRERLMLPERFNRMLSAIRTIENAQHEAGIDHFPKVIEEAFFLLYKIPILNASIHLPS